MSITLTWIDRNVGSTGTKVYRSETAFDKTSLPAALDTVAAGVNQFTDENVERNKLYFYRLGVMKGAEEIISDLKVVGKYPDTGPGNALPIRGDFRDGYFGTVSFAEMFTSAELFSLCDSPGSYINVTTKWFKYAIDGKILFIPDGFISQSVTWTALYQKGLVYGVDGPGHTPATAPVNQLKIVEKGAHRFKVRLLIGSNEPTEYKIRTEADAINSEFSRTFFRSVNFATGFPKWNDLPHGDLVRVSSGADILFQDNGQSLNYRLSRGYTFPYGSFKQPSVAAAEGWLPVLELIL